jgi:pantothenate kinase
MTPITLRPLKGAPESYDVIIENGLVTVNLIGMML